MGCLLYWRNLYLGCPNQYHGVSGPTLDGGAISDVHGMYDVLICLNCLNCVNQSCSDCVTCTHDWFSMFFLQLPNGLSHPSTKHLCHIQPSRHKILPNSRPSKTRKASTMHLSLNPGPKNPTAQHLPKRFPIFLFWWFRICKAINGWKLLWRQAIKRKMTSPRRS